MAQPFLLGISVYDTDTTTAVPSVTVTVRNEQTNDFLTEITDATGKVVFNLANFANGWSTGDKVTYFVSYEGYSAFATISLTDTGGVTTTLTLSAITVSTLRYFTVQEFLDTFNLCTYDDNHESGVKPQTIVKVGQAIESEIDRATNQTFDKNSGSYYTVTDEYHSVESPTHYVYFARQIPIYSVTTVSVNTNPVDTDASWNTVAAADLLIDYNTGRIELRDSSDYFPEPGTDQVKITYKYGSSSVPYDVKRLAILMTARAFASQMLQRLNITANESAGLSSALQTMSNYDSEIDRIIQSRRIAPIENVWN